MKFQERGGGGGGSRFKHLSQQGGGLELFQVNNSVSS